MRDTYRHKGLRRRMVNGLMTKGLSDEKVINAMLKVPRHYFVDNAFVEHAYEDKAFPIAAGQTISHPSTVAMQSQLLEVESGMRVLEIGTGSGYQAAILAEMGTRLVSIERQRALYLKTSPLLKSMSYRLRLFYGDGYKGKAAYGPYDRIIVTCGAPVVPQALLEQLKNGGVMVIPVGGDSGQEMIKVKRTPQGTYEEENHGDYSFVPMLEKKNFGG
ncbi:MAG: protein-L-isoaspartate(D-aspartate) O-methyltransferase [Flavobacteriales bacterium]|nr:protein-L-isoaspartate(D-aspartate) O-methyltransferase [Flavobacteriales bacterium]